MLRLPRRHRRRAISAPQFLHLAEFSGLLSVIGRHMATPLRARTILRLRCYSTPMSLPLACVALTALDDYHDYGLPISRLMAMGAPDYGRHGVGALRFYSPSAAPRESSAAPPPALLQLLRAPVAICVRRRQLAAAE